MYDRTCTPLTLNVPLAVAVALAVETAVRVPARRPQRARQPRQRSSPGLTSQARKCPPHVARSEARPPRRRSNRGLGTEAARRRITLQGARQPGRRSSRGLSSPGHRGRPSAPRLQRARQPGRRSSRGLTSPGTEPARLRIACREAGPPRVRSRASAARAPDGPSALGPRRPIRARVPERRVRSGAWRTGVCDLANSARREPGLRDVRRL
jgi:hypothetical protein